MRLAIIPARGGSKRVPEKNIRDFCGRPIIAYSIDAARASGLFDSIHVSTESASVRAVVEQCGLAVDFMRPADLADDHTPIMPVVRFVIQRYLATANTVDSVCVIGACSPLLDADDLRQACAMFESRGGTRPVISVTRYEAPIERAFTMRENGELVPVQPGMFKARSQDLVAAYYHTSDFAFHPTGRALSLDIGGDTDLIGYVLQRGKSVDIDGLDDWRLAEQLYRGRQRRL
jgi:pseudaminic acid cytidylyltransferase